MRRFATPEVAQDLQKSGFSLGGKRVRGSVMFSDIRAFTALVESQPPEETIDLLNTYYTLMFDAISGHGGIVSLIVGDGLMAIFGAPLPLPHHCESAVRAALEMIEMVELFNLERTAIDKPEIRIGIGIASGEMVAGYTGTFAASHANHYRVMRDAGGALHIQLHCGSHPDDYGVMRNVTMT